MTNIHMHIFTMDHTPPIQLVYMVKDILRSVLPVWIPMQRVDEKRRMPLLSLVAPLVSPFVQSRLDSFVRFLTSVSEIEVRDLVAHESTEELFTRRRKLSLRRLVRYLRRRLREGDTFEGVVIRLVTALYQINNNKAPKRQDQRSLLTTFLRSIAHSTPYDRLVVLSMDFDNAFRHSYDPGFPPPAVAGFNFRFPRLPFRRREAGPNGAAQSATGRTDQRIGRVGDVSREAGAGPTDETERPAGVKHTTEARPGVGPVDETDESAAPVPAQSTGAELPHGEPSQIEELTDVVADTSEIAGAAGYNRELTVLPFYCMDPRSYPDGAGARAAMASAEAAGYAGVKIYSPLGYLPADPRLADVFELCLEDGLPVLAHCGRGGAGHKGAVNHSDLAHPYNWIPVLDHLEAKYHGTTLPNGPFRLCLAHFDSLEDDADFAWWDEIINLIEKYLDSRTVRVYVDVSANYPGRRRVARRYFDRLSSRVFGDSRLERRLLFGSDWWMQLYSVSETEYLYTYFERYAGRRFYPEPSGGESLEELFEANAKEYLGRWY